MISFDGREEAKKLDALITEHLQTKHLQAPPAGDAQVSSNVSAPSGKLLILQVGENPSSQRYVKLKTSFCDKNSIPCEHVLLPAAWEDEKLSDEILRYSKDPKYSSIIIQLPLPRPSLGNLVDLIPAEKDIDMLSAKSRCAYYALKDMSELVELVSFKKSPVVRATEHFLAFANLDDVGQGEVKPKSIHAATHKSTHQEASIIGYGELVGKPLEKLLTLYGFRVSIYDKDSEVQDKVFKHTLNILSTGVPSLLKGTNFVAGTSVIDFGSAVVEEKIHGDLDASSSLEHLKYVSLSPGGMGPLVVRYLVMNHLGI